MPVIQTAELRPGSLDASANHQVYCGLDSAITLEVNEELGRQFNQPPAIYSFTRELQGPYLDIMRRGFAVDSIGRHQAAQVLRRRLGTMMAQLDRLAMTAWDRPLNARSSDQLKSFFYLKLRLPEVWQSQKGQRKLSMNREALEKLETHLYARPFISLILAIRDLAKQLEVLETSIDSDGRFRTSYNIVGTETGRPSSSENAFGTGGNAQNISPALRYVFVSDPGYKLAVIDLEQVEARDVGFFCGCLFGDWSYLDACESGDLHSNNAKRIWPELSWPGNAAGDRAIADSNFYREFSYRDMAKRGSHLSNYMGTAWTASRFLKVPVGIMEEFQARYIRGRAAKPGRPAINPAFPVIAQFWDWIASELQTTSLLETPFGRRRHFFGRPGDDTTLREAIAFMPQSTTADRTNLGLWRIWKRMPEVQVLAQTYDSVTFQYREDADEAEILSRALELMRVELIAPSGRSYVVPGEAKIGWNWGNAVSETDVAKAKAGGKRLPRLNPGGLKKWSPKSPDTRQRPSGSLIGK